MKIFLDTEFTGLRQDTTLISIALIAENNEIFYGELTDYNRDQVTPWIQENVINNLYLKQTKDNWMAIERDRENPNNFFYLKPNLCQVKGQSKYAKKHLTAWVKKFGQVEIWSDCLAYDWVLFCNLFGGAFSVPKNIFYIPFDLATLFKIKGIDPDINREEFVFGINSPKEAKKHNALWDAQVIKACVEKLA